jgi:hypothetical protein
MSLSASCRYVMTTVPSHVNSPKFISLPWRTPKTARSGYGLYPNPHANEQAREKHVWKIKEPELTSIPSFINTLDTNKGWLPGNFDIPPRTMRALRKAGLSKAVLTNIYSKHAYWAKMGNQRVLHRDEHDALESLGTSHVYLLNRANSCVQKSVTSTVAGGIRVSALSISYTFAIRVLTFASITLQMRCRVWSPL